MTLLYPRFRWPLFSRGHFVVFPRSSSPVLSFSSPLPATIFCVVIFPQHLSSLLHSSHSRVPRSAPFLLSTLAELPIMWSSGHLSSIFLQMRLKALTMTICGNTTVTWGTVSAIEGMCENTGIGFSHKLLSFSWGVVLDFGKYGTSFSSYSITYSFPLGTAWHTWTIFDCHPV